MRSEIAALILFSILILDMGCSEQLEPQTSDEVADTSIENVIVLQDSIVNMGTFSYYSPTEWKSDSRLPVVLFFDPKGVGHEPIDKYKALAKELGLIIAASNVSKNGLDMTAIRSHYKELSSELRKLFPNNGGHFILVGFSGGAKVAIQLGMTDPSVLGIIANGAMSDLTQQRPNLPVALISGKGDLNYSNMLMSSFQMIPSRPSTVFMQFDGGHEWSNREELTHSLVWILSKAGFKFTNERAELAGRMIEKVSDSRDLDEFVNTQALSILYADLEGAESVRARLQEMAISGDLSAWLDAFYQELDEEEAAKQDYIKRLDNSDLEWWKAEISRLNLNTESDGETSFKSQRMLGFLGLYCYMKAKSEFKQNGAYPKDVVEVYLQLEPDNPEAQRMKESL